MVCGSRPIKRRRRTKADMDVIRQTIVDVAESDPPITVRQGFYQLVSRGVIDKTESEYKTIVRLLTQLRRDGQIPFEWIADTTRWMRKPRTHSNMAHLLEESIQMFRRSIWEAQDVYVEIWMEKEALAGVLYEETERWDVPLMVTRGYSSISFLHSAAQTIESVDKPAYLYYLGDFDPSGLDIARKVEDGIRELAPLADVTFERVAVTPAQINAWDLPTRPTKKTDTRSRNFEGESVELDAIPPSQLRALVAACIEEHVDQNILGDTKRLEALEQRSGAETSSG